VTLHNNDSYAWKQARKRILARDEYTCQECGAVDESGRSLHIDHVEPKAAGGTDDDWNLRTVCAKHNLKKGAKTGPQRAVYVNPRWLSPACLT
jgi:5-methylcytosine-specific restriction endonuclease McrA